MRTKRAFTRQHAITAVCGLASRKIAFCRKILGVTVLSIITSGAMAGAGDSCSIKLSGVTFTKCLNGAEKNTVVNGDVVTLTSDAKKDFFNDPGNGEAVGNAPVLLAKVDNAKPFTLTAKVSPEFKQTYDAGALYVYVSSTLWQKFAFERDERAVSRIVSVRTIETSDDNNHQNIGQPSVYLKISSDSKTIAFYFSQDNKTWNLAKLYKNEYPKVIWVGVSSQSPIGDGNKTLFENVSLTHESVKDFRMGI